ncbi:MAG: zinc ribbon domain-containing protein [Clostridiales bacterium]|nr:zinc ribbon domain-containing protein [Clostridiales bacterium]
MAGIKFCSKCGRQAEESAKFCNGCGAPFAVKQQSTSPVQQPTPPFQQPQGNMYNQQPTPPFQQPPSLQNQYYGQQTSVNPAKKKSKKPAAIIISLLVVLILGGFGLYSFMPQLFSGLTAIGGGKPTVPAILVEGNGSGNGLEISGAVKAAEAVIPEGGGTVTVEDKESPVRGMTIKVPEGAYPSDTSFAVSTSVISSNGYSKDLKFISPVIHVENGGEYAQDIIEVRVPCTVPENSVPMAFYYNPDNGKLDPIPVLSYDRGSVTYAVEHFSDTVVGIMDKLFGENGTTVDTGFTPGVDDFSFTNFGSALAPGGHCEGQCLSAIYYFNNLKASKGALYNQFDNYTKNLNITFSSKGFQEDDVLAYRVASVTQEEVASLWSDMFIRYVGHMNISNQQSFDMIATHLKLSQSPQVLAICVRGANNDYSKGHAIIAYKVEGNRIYVADPNYPGKKDRFIEIENGKFKAYSSGANAQDIADGNSVAYNMVMIVGSVGVRNYNSIGDTWKKLDTRDVGDNYFPESGLKLNVIEEEKQEDETLDPVEVEKELTDGYTASKEEFVLKLAPLAGGSFAANVLYSDGKNAPKYLQEDPNTKRFTTKLGKGENYIGVKISKKVGNQYCWYDFKWYRVNFNTPTMDELAGQYDDGTITISDVFISQALRDEAKAKAEAEKAAAEAAAAEGNSDPFSSLGQGCDLELIEQLDKMKGQVTPTVFHIEKVSDEKGKFYTVDEDGKRTDIPFDYKDGILTFDYTYTNPSGEATDGSSGTFKFGGTMNATYVNNTKVMVEGKLKFWVKEKPDDFYLIESIKGTKDIPAKEDKK